MGCHSPALFNPPIRRTRMKRIAIVLFVLLIGCYDDLQNFFYPADMYVHLPNSKELRVHCFDRCPSSANILKSMELVNKQMSPYVDYDLYDQWAKYAITFRDAPMEYLGHPVLGATLHNRAAIAIWMSYECNGPEGICSGVIGHELKLAALEKQLPRSNEQQKLDWLIERRIENITWTKEDFQ